MKAKRYGCDECGKTVTRESNARTIRSWCDKTGKTTQLRRRARSWFGLRVCGAFVRDLVAAPVAIGELFLSPEALVRRSRREVTRG